MNTFLTVGLLFILVFIGYKLFQVVFKSIIVGILAAFIPIAAVVFGLDIGISPTLNNMLWFAVFGVMSYFVYASVNMGVKTIKLIMRPFGAMFGKKGKDKVIVKEIHEVDKKKRRS